MSVLRRVVNAIFAWYKAVHCTGLGSSGNKIKLRFAGLAGGKYDCRDYDINFVIVEYLFHAI